MGGLLLGWKEESLIAMRGDSGNQNLKSEFKIRTKSEFKIRIKYQNKNQNLKSEQNQNYKSELKIRTKIRI